MKTMKYITDEEYNNAIDAEIHLSTVPSIIYTTNKAPYFSDYAIERNGKLGF